MTHETHPNPSSQEIARGTEERLKRLEDALRSIHAARLHHGEDRGYGWNITALNRAMNKALPLIGKTVPAPMPIDHAALTAALSTLRKDEDEAADTITTLKGEIERRDEIYRDRLRSMRPSSARSDDFLAGYKAAVDEALLAIGAEVIIP